MNILLIFFIAASSPTLPASDSILVKFDSESAQWASPPSGFSAGEFDFGEDDERAGKFAFVRYDLSGDGKEEYFLRALCGNGGCEYGIYDGKTLQQIGDIFGSPVWIRSTIIKKLPVIESYNHMSAAYGLLTRYEFDGNQYQRVSSDSISGAPVDSVFRILKGVLMLK